LNDQSKGERERRAAGRIDTEGKLPGQLPLDLETDVLQISVGGMMVEVTMPLEVGSKHQFTLNINEEALEVQGIVRNCKPFPSEKESRDYRVGIEFCDLGERQRASLAEFVNRLLGS
jgi:c-di-GMP-binding flagellar brake protein YcgR